MRSLVILQGIPGSGKSTWIKENNLEQYTISSDAIRLLYSSPISNESGIIGIPQYLNKTVWETLYKVLECRMQNGDFTIVDATNLSKDCIQEYQRLAKLYKYRLYYKEFNLTLEEAIERNKNREPYRQVSEKVLQKMMNRRKDFTLPTRWSKIDSLEDLEYTPINCSNYKEIKIIGDIHGCYDVLAEAIEHTIDPDILYIFVGDYFDRGIQNKEVFDFIIENKDKPNIIFIEGNHERHIFSFIENQKYSNSFKESLDQIKEAYTEEEIRNEFKPFYRKLAQCFYFKYNEKTFLVTHGGVKFNNRKLYEIPFKELRNGTGDYTYELNKFQDEKSIIQVFGHRNMPNTDTLYNLENSVEFGGYLEVLSITKESIVELKYKNNVFSVKENKSSFDKEEDYNVLYQYDHIRPFLIKKDNINIKSFRDNSIFSINFNRKTFSKGQWDPTTINARGLFVDKHGKIICRGFSKFFNIEEGDAKNKNEYIPSIKNFKFPLIPYKKYNGFLGMLSVYNDEFFFATKSTIEGEHVEYFKELFYKLSESTKKLLYDQCKTYDVTLLFEVMHEKDPHIILNNPENQLAFLSSIKNNLNGERHNTTYKEICNYLFHSKILEPITYPTCIYGFSIENEKEYNLFYTHIKDFTKCEGAVCIDAEGKMFKIKSNFYLKGRRLRNKERLKDTKDPLYLNFSTFCKEQEIEDESFPYRYKLFNDMKNGTN